MVVREKRELDFRPVLVKFGVGLAISLGGIFCAAIVRCRGIKPPKSKLSHPSPDLGALSDAGEESDCPSNDDHALEREPSVPENNFQSSVSELSSNGRNNGDKGLILPEFGELVKECNLDGTMGHITPVNILETQPWGIESPTGCECTEHDEHNREIQSLWNQVKVLEERERYLEIQLLEYYGLKEQESAVMELQNRLRINNTEAKLYNHKIESLESDNRRLEAQVTDYANVVVELDTANAKIKVLRKKLRFEAQQNREQILSIQERVMNMRDEEIRTVDVEMQRREKKVLEQELEQAKNYNQDLKMANSELAQKLECLQMRTTSALDNEEEHEFKEENQCLQKQNKDLEKEIEQLQADRCTDLEELVYLRWINACLRYELRNYQPGPGRTVARDLSKSLSPESEKKAKQLILEYADREVSSITDIDSDQWFTFQASLTDPDTPDSFRASTTTRSSRMKVFAKLMKLLRGKDYSNHIQACPLPMGEAESADDILDRHSSDSHSIISDALTRRH